MYRQIRINENQASLQTILWREDPNDAVGIFELVTVAYIKPALFLAVRCLQQLVEIEKANFSIAAEVVCRDFYMDDLLTSANIVQDVI